MALAKQRRVRDQSEILIIANNQSLIGQQLPAVEEHIAQLANENENLKRELSKTRGDIAELNRSDIERLAEEVEIERLKKIFIESTLTRQIVPKVPFWKDHLDGIKQATFFSYLNPICATTWLNVCDKISLAGRAKRVLQEFEDEKKKKPTAIQAIHQVLCNDGLGHFIRPKEVYVNEYIELRNK
ncbi:Conserved hypothetical protein [Candidatus Protochlamydia naegleriophila]|uniref:Uncharacterized protein n=1 Tax=Candidatus Protochlamydia naegleriophila TaxID=389348 RepID=A0A0U5JDC3_9BACT|nr:hypothetical protein [Candidatus Protochlamydia naegleriophila]CUI16788.1 Conserved hypothetical protein [Candidatus Protochlamydia naegleriophila]